MSRSIHFFEIATILNTRTEICSIINLGWATAPGFDPSLCFALVFSFVKEPSKGRLIRNGALSSGFLDFIGRASHNLLSGSEPSKSTFNCYGNTLPLFVHWVASLELQFLAFEDRVVGLRFHEQNASYFQFSRSFNCDRAKAIERIVNANNFSILNLQQPIVSFLGLLNIRANNAFAGKTMMIKGGILQYIANGGEVRNSINTRPSKGNIHPWAILDINDVNIITCTVAFTPTPVTRFDNPRKRCTIIFQGSAWDSSKKRKPTNVQ